MQKIQDLQKLILETILEQTAPWRRDAGETILDPLYAGPLNDPGRRVLRYRFALDPDSTSAYGCSTSLTHFRSCFMMLSGDEADDA